MRLLRCRYPYEPWACTVCGRDQSRPPASTQAGLVCERCLDRGCRGEPFVPLTVAPAAPTKLLDERPIVAVCMKDRRVIVEDGETFDLEQLVERLRERKPGEVGGGRRHEIVEQLPPALVVTDRGVDLIAYLDHSELAEHPLWDWQVGLRAQGAWRPEARGSGREFIVPKPVQFGFASRRSGRRRAHGKARWYQLLDVNVFVELPEGWGEPDAGELLRFGMDLRTWANRNRLPVLTSASAYGSRLLRDSRFGGGWRRKVPAATNAAVRQLLPGNHYQLLTGRRVFAQAHKLDQQRAHHHAAFMTRFPHANGLVTDGFFRQPAPPRNALVGGTGGIRAGSNQWVELLRRPGLFIIAAEPPELVAIDQLTIPGLRKAGMRWRVLTSVEIEHACQLQVPFGDIWACWTSPEEDDRLRDYALWADGQLAGALPVTKHWLKPTLLAAYGMLAARPRRFRSAWKWVGGKHDGAVGWQTPYGALVGLEKSSKRERETQTANVLWRALIESRVRLESLTYAQQLRAGGYTPIAIYADAVFVTGGAEPPAPPPWRYEGLVNRLEFESAQRYRSREETRLPGTVRGVQPQEVEGNGITHH